MHWFPFLTPPCGGLAPTAERRVNPACRYVGRSGNAWRGLRATTRLAKTVGSSSSPSASPAAPSIPGGFYGANRSPISTGSCANLRTAPHRLRPKFVLFGHLSLELPTPLIQYGFRKY